MSPAPTIPDSVVSASGPSSTAEGAPVTEPASRSKASSSAGPAAPIGTSAGSTASTAIVSTATKHSGWSGTGSRAYIATLSSVSIDKAGVDGGLQPVSMIPTSGIMPMGTCSTVAITR